MELNIEKEDIDQEWFSINEKLIEDNINSRDLISFLNLCFKEIEKYNKVVNYIYMSRKIKSSLLSFLGTYFLGELGGDYYGDGKIWTASVMGDDSCKNQVVFSTKKLNIEEIL